MIEPAVLLEGFVCEEPERVTCPLLRLGVSDPIAIGCDREGGETKAGGGYAGYVEMVLIERCAVYAGSIANEAGIRVSFFPEVLKGATLEVFKEDFVRVGEFIRRDRLKRRVSENRDWRPGHY
jgi:hypothetical protein